VTEAGTIRRPTADELVVLVGPTASGKTDLALRLARAWDGEIVGADSVQIYRGFDIGSGKPTAEQQELVPHHLVDCADPLEPFDAARFAELADRAIGQIRGRGRVAIVCGGTFLWVKALLHGLAPAPPADRTVRDRPRQLVDEHGREALHERLRAVDPDSAARLAPRDAVRVSRALEIHELSGRSQTAWHAEHQFRERRHRYQLIGVRRERAELDARIRARTRAWLEQGWVHEVEGLIAAGYRDARAMASVGYRQVRDRLEGALDEAAVEQAIVRATRVFVRRQRTWLRDAAEIAWLDSAAIVQEEI
jgi:tRNA dimethylallyltransferase